MFDSKQNKSAEREFFNQFNHQQPYDVFTESGNCRLLDQMFASIDSTSSLRGLDMGCGTGTFSEKYRRRGIDVTGIDISDKSIRAAQGFYPDCDFIVGNIEKTPFLDESFDIVFLSGVLHHFPEPAQLVHEINRVLKPGGRVVGFDPHYYNPFMYLYRVKSSPFYSSKGVTENEQPITKGHAKYYFEEEGFSDVEVRVVSGVAFKYVESSLANSFLSLYNLFDKCLDIPPLRSLFGSFVISIARK